MDKTIKRKDMKTPAQQLVKTVTQPCNRQTLGMILLEEVDLMTDEEVTFILDTLGSRDIEKAYTILKEKRRLTPYMVDRSSLFQNGVKIVH